MDECQRLLNYEALTPSPGSWSASCEIGNDEDTWPVMFGQYLACNLSQFLFFLSH